jgi:DNA methyltransferase 1-associated protein 1
VGRLIDLRKVREKEEGEIRVLEAMKARRAGGEQGENTPSASVSGSVRDGSVNHGSVPPKLEVQDSMETPGLEGDGEDDRNEDDDGDEDEDAEGGQDGDEMEDEDGDVDAEGEEESRQPSEMGASSRAQSQGAHTLGRKRSASVFSQTSSGTTKRARK